MDINVLDSNQRYILVSNHQDTFLLDSPTCKILKKKNSSYNLGSLQYSTGISVLCKGSLATFYGNTIYSQISSLEKSSIQLIPI